MIRTTVILLLAAAAGLAQTEPAPKDGGAVAFTGVHVHVGDGTVIDDATVVVKDGKILAAGKGVAVPGGARRRDMKGAHLTPGLIDAAAAGLISRDATEQISEDVAGWRVIDGLDMHSEEMKTLAAEGVTTVFASASTSSVLGCRGATVKTGDGDTAGRILVADGDPKLTLTHAPSSGNGRPGSNKTVYTRRPTSQMGVNFVARDELSKAREALREGRAGEDANQRVLGQVLSHERPIRVLAERQYELATAVRLAKEFGFDFIIENGAEVWRYLDEVKASGASIVFGPIVSKPTSGRGRFRRREPKYRRGTATKLKEKGIRFAVTAAGRTGEWGLVRQVTEAVRHGLAPADALAAVTTEPAKLLGVAGRTGKIAAGLDADLIVWSGPPFEPTSRPVVIMVNGREVKPRIL